ncbi:MAG: hypothetical protein ACXWZG_04080 [Microbacterium sp.]
MSSAISRAARVTLLVSTAFVAVTAFLGGLALALGALVPSLATALSPPPEYLAGTPFGSYLLPGLVLGIIVGGTHALAFVLVLRRHRWGDFASAVAAFAVLIWIFIQMIYIPFSFLQAVYFVAGAAEAGLVMVRLNLFGRLAKTA